MKGKKMKIFKNEGSVRDTELKIVNFRPIGTNKNGEAEISNKQWEEVSKELYFLLRIYSVLVL